MDDLYFSNYKNNQTGSPPTPPNRKPQNINSGRKKHTLLKTMISILLAIVLFFTGVFGYVYNLMRTTDYNPAGHAENVYVNKKDLMHDDHVLNILFIGVDRRVEDVASRSDSMILFSIDKNNHKIKLTSFMRDTWVDIPGKDYAKLNAACTYGGAQLVMDTIECNFNIHIDNYALVDFDTFATIVNKLGGVNVEISKAEAQYMRDRVHLKTIKAGKNIHLNGNEALWYCRIRYLDSDFMRTYRQRKVITSIISKAKSSGLSNLLNLVKTILPDVETDLNALSLTKLAFGAAASYIHYDIEQTRVPANGTWKNATKNGQDVLQADLGANQEMLRKYLYTNDADKEATTE